MDSFAIGDVRRIRLTAGRDRRNLWLGDITLNDGKSNEGKYMRWSMSGRVLSVLAILTSLSAASSVLAADNALPGDRGRPGGDGVPRANPQPGGPPPAMPPPAAPVAAPSMALALKAVEAIAEGCHQHKLGIAVVNAEGVPILTYVPDGSEAWHTYTAIRKAYTAVTFKVPTSELISRTEQDPEFAGKIRADSNLVAFKGGIPLKTASGIIGAIGVSGAEPGGHDEECGMMGLSKIRDQLK
jgi:uncharacterized protein GlcG (DUF336 family)